MGYKFNSESVVNKNKTRKIVTSGLSIADSDKKLISPVIKKVQCIKNKQRSGKGKRQRAKKRKLQSFSLGCPFSGKTVVFRVEMAYENKLNEQNNISIHWIQVRKFEGKELKKYQHYFNTKGTPLEADETVELRHLMAYLDTFFYQRRDFVVNTFFIFPATKVKDENVKFPIRQMLLDRNSVDTYGINDNLLTAYRNTVYHQYEGKKRILQTLSL